MSKLISKADVIPQSLYITNVSVDADHSLIGIGGNGRVFKGTYKEDVVALKMLDDFTKGRDHVSPFSLSIAQYYLFDGKLFQEFCKEALVWRSLRHLFILPLLGIFKDQRAQYIVLPLMPNGTLMDWRRKVMPLSLAEIHRLVRF